MVLVWYQCVSRLVFTSNLWHCEINHTKNSVIYVCISYRMFSVCSFILPFHEHSWVKQWNTCLGVTHVWALSSCPMKEQGLIRWKTEHMGTLGRFSWSKSHYESPLATVVLLKIQHESQSPMLFYLRTTRAQIGAPKGPTSCPESISETSGPTFIIQESSEISPKMCTSYVFLL